jgi:hypothetical protein
MSSETLNEISISDLHSTSLKSNRYVLKMSAANLLENGDFNSTNGDSAVGWRGFGNSGVSIHPKEKYNGKNCCITSKRAKNSYGPCQDVLYTVQLGKQCFTTKALVVYS